MNTWIKHIIENSERVAIPIMTHPGIKETGHTVKEAVTNGEIHFQAIKAVSDTYQTVACTVIMDLTVEAEAFGALVYMSEHEIPNVVGRIVHDFESVEKLQCPSLSAGRIPEFLKANRLAVEHSSGKPVLAGCIGPFSLAGRLFDMSEIMMAIYLEPETIQLLLDKCTDFIISYCMELKASGTAAVVVAEPAAGLLSNDDCLIYSSNYVKRIVEAVQDDSFAVILHNCGNRGQCTQAMIETGCVALHFGNTVDIIEALNTGSQDMLIMGNIDPVGVLKQSSAEDVYRITAELLEKTAHYPNFVLSSGCDMPPGVPIDNIRAFYQALADFNARR